MTDRVSLGKWRGLEKPVFVEGRKIGDLVLNPCGFQFMPLGSRVYLNADELQQIAKMLGSDGNS